MCYRAGIRDFDHPNVNVCLKIDLELSKSEKQEASENLPPSQTPIEGFFLLINAHERIILMAYFK